MNKCVSNLNFKVYTTLEKAGSSGTRRIIRGYASVGDVLDRQNEVIALSALRKAKDDLLKNNTIFYEHKHSELPIGKTIAVDLDEKGLLITVELSMADFVNPIWTLIQEGILNSFSIGGRVLEAEERRNKSGQIYTEITSIELFETSVVGLPANPAAKFELISKSFNMAITEEIRKREVEANMSDEIKEVEKSVEVEAVVKETVVEKEVEKEIEAEVEKAVEVEVEKAVEVEAEKEIEAEVEKAVEVVVEKEVEAVVEKAVEVVKEETSLEEDTKEVEKSTDEKILETLSLILKFVSKEAVVEKAVEVEKEVEAVVEDVVEKAVEAEVEKAVEVEVEKAVEVEAEKEVVVEKEVEKSVDEAKVEETDIETKVRKGEVVLAEAPYSNEEVIVPKMDEKTYKRMKDANWSKMIFGK